MKNPSPFEKGFVYRATKVVVEHLDDADFSVRDLAHHLHFSREQTHRKLKKGTGLSSGKFIRYVRLLYAYHFLQAGSESVQEVGYRVGFNDPAYFNKCFKEEWKVTPGRINRENPPFSEVALPIVQFYQVPAIKDLLQKAGVVLEPGPQAAVNHRPGRNNRKWMYVLLILAVVLLVATQIQFSPPVEKIDLENQRLAVVPFVNNTGDTSLHFIGDIASSWISSQIDDLDEVKTVPFFTIKQYSDYLGILPDDRQNRPTFGEVVDAAYILQGQYFLKEGKLFFDTELLDAKTQRSIYHLDMVSGPQDKDSIMGTVENLRLEIAGLLSSLEEVKLGKLTPPNYNAYLFYLRGIEGLRNGYYSSENARENFEKAVATAPDFVMANIFLKMFFYGYRKDSILARIENVPRITQYEKFVLQHLRLRLEHRFSEALNLSLSMLKEYPKDYYFNLFAGHEAKSQFMPRLAIQILSQVQDPVNSEAGLVWHYFKVRNYTESLLALGEYNKALSYLHSIPPTLYNHAVPEHLIYIHIRLGKGKEAIKELIDSFDDRVNKKILADFYTDAAYEYILINEDEAAWYFIDRAAEVMHSFPDEKGHAFDLVDLLFMAGDYSSAREQLEKLRSQNEEEYWVYLSLIEAATGHADKALDIYDRELPDGLISWRRNPIEYQADYMKARVYALLGQEHKAITFLELALQKGQLCHHLDFHRDIFLKSIFDVPRFKELTRPREFTGVFNQVQ